MNDPNSQDRMRPRGGYRTLHSFRTATLVYDGSVNFCNRFVSPHSRLVDQMVQAARSGRQNIAEGCRASATGSKQQPPAQGPFPPCPKCGGPLVLRTARQGANAGSQFLGCAAYPACKGTRAL
jgi:hypothetical protein